MADPILDPRKPKELARECPLDIYLSGSDGGGYGSTYFPWAYRMNRTKDNGLTPTYVEDCDKFILDSAINVDEITNDDVINDVEQYDPDYVIAADVLYDQEETTARVIEFLDLLDDTDSTAEPIIPLQPSSKGNVDHHEHYHDLSHLGDYFAIGGMKDITDHDLMRFAAEFVAEETGEGDQLHGLGFGIGYLTDPRVRENPILDSVDCSTPIHEGKAGRMHLFNDNEYDVVQMPKPKGRISLLRVSLASATTLVSMAQMMLNGHGEVE